MDQYYFNELITYIRECVVILQYKLHKLRHALAGMEQDLTQDNSAEFAELLGQIQETYTEAFREYSRIMREGSDSQINEVWSVYADARRLQQEALRLDIGFSRHREWRVRRRSWLNQLMYNLLGR